MKLMHLALVGVGLYLLAKRSSASGAVGGALPLDTPPPEPDNAPAEPEGPEEPAFTSALEGWKYYHNALQSLSTWAINARRAANGDISAQIRLIENNAMRDTAGQAFVNPNTGLRDASISDYLQSLYQAAGANSDLISTYYKQQQAYLYSMKKYYEGLKYGTA